jgi:hypothetical protein
MIQCFEEDDGSLTITWDDTDPVESVLNTWTEQDFIDAILITYQTKEPNEQHIHHRRSPL